MTNPLANVDWEKLSPEEKVRTRNVELWSSRVVLVESTVRALDGLMGRCGLSKEEIEKHRASLAEIVTSVHRKHDEEVND